MVSALAFALPMQAIKGFDAKVAFIPNGADADLVKALDVADSRPALLALRFTDKKTASGGRQPTAQVSHRHSGAWKMKALEGFHNHISKLPYTSISFLEVEVDLWIGHQESPMLYGG